MIRGALRRVRAALAVDGDPYAQLDRGAATRLGGAMYLLGFAFAAIALPLAPPSGPLGAPGVAATMVVAIACGAYLLRRREPAHPDLLLFGSYLGLAAAAVFRMSAGPGAPFDQLLFVAAIYTCAIHPLRRALFVLLFASAIAATPMGYETVGADFAASTVSQLALTWSVGLLVLGWQTRVRRLRAKTEAEREAAMDLARVDALTGMANRRALEEALPVAVAAARRTGRPMSVLVGDLDAFKAVNDVHGHQAGDDLLRSAARSFTAALRLTDPSFRFGGDEFVAVLPDAALDQAREIAGRVHSTVALACRTPDGGPVRITVGVAQLCDGDTGADVFARADADLLKRKARRRSGPGRAALAG